MKTTLLITLLFGATLASVQVQNFRAVPPAEQSNAAELASFGGKNPTTLTYTLTHCP